MAAGKNPVPPSTRGTVWVIMSETEEGRMFEFLYNLVNHKYLHMWDVLCIVLLLVMLIIAGVHIYKQRKREDDFEDELEERFENETAKENLSDVRY